MLIGIDGNFTPVNFFAKTAHESIKVLVGLFNPLPIHHCIVHFHSPRLDLLASTFS